MRNAHYAVLGTILLPAIACGQSAFDGIWRPEPEKPIEKPQRVVLADGIYDCQSCTPPYQVKADGRDQPVAGNPYFEAIRISIIDEHSIAKIATRGGKVVMDSKETVAADGAGKTEVQTLIGMAPVPIELTSKSSRIGTGSPGAHAISGSWQIIELDVSNHAEDTTFKVRNGALSMTDRMGRSFVAKLDGSRASYLGSDQFDGVSVKMIDKMTIEESDLKNGTVVKITRWALSADGDTIHARFDDMHGHIQQKDGHKVP